MVARLTDFHRDFGWCCVCAGEEDLIHHGIDKQFSVLGRGPFSLINLMIMRGACERCWTTGPQMLMMMTCHLKQQETTREFFCGLEIQPPYSPSSLSPCCMSECSALVHHLLDTSDGQQKRENKKFFFVLFFCFLCVWTGASQGRANQLWKGFQLYLLGLMVKCIRSVGNSWLGGRAD